MLTIRTLGHVSIEVDGRPLHFESRTVAAMLIYLACQRNAVGRETLAELFWPERTPKQARSNVRVALHRLRQQVAAYLLITQSGAALKPDAAITVDAIHFERQIAAGHLAEATTRYHNDFLTDFYLDGSPLFEQWALLERERLRTLALAAYQQLIHHYATAGAVTAATATAQRLLHLDPLHEPTHRQLMRLFAQAGQRSAALTQFERCRQLLTAELAVPPDETTTALAEQIRMGELGIRNYELRADTTTEQAFVTRNSELVIRHNLPLQPTPFIGRSADLAHIGQRLANPDCRLLTLLGVGGIGKTRLAIEAGRLLGEADQAPLTLHDKSNGKIQLPTFADGVCYVALAPVDAVELVPVTIAQSLGLATNSSNLLAEIAAYLRPRRLLLILDNLEHLLAAVDTVIYLLEQAPQVKMLVTSRQRLHLREEWLLPISGLAFTGAALNGTGVNQAVAGEAEVLFLYSAQRVQPGFQAQGQEAAIATVCQLVEGMPLALELAASWVRVMPCREIAHRIQQDADFLTMPLRNLPERHRSVRALFDHSWRLLSPVEQGVLMRLSVFRGGCQVEEAIAVTGATLTLLLGLVDQSLVRVNGQQRFDLHELVRQYAAEQLTASGETDLIRQRHYAAYLQLFRTGDSHLRGLAAVSWLARLAAEQDNLRAALQWSLAEQRYAETAWLVLAANWFWNHHGYYYEGASWVVPLLPHRQVLDPELRLALLISFHAYAPALEDPHSVMGYRAEFLELLESSSHRLLQSAAWAWVAIYAADPAQAVAAHEQAIAAARAADPSSSPGAAFCLFTDRDFLLGLTLVRYATHLLQQGEVGRATALATESFQLFVQRNRYERAHGLSMLGRLALLRGDLAQAHALLQEAIQIAIAAHGEHMLGGWQPLLGLVMLYSGDTPGADQLLQASLRLCLEMKNKFHLATVYTYLAEAALWAGEPGAAAQWLQQSLATSGAPAWVTLDEVQRLWVAARLAIAQQQYQRSATLFGLADGAHSQIHHAIGGPMCTLADAALATVQAALEPTVFVDAFAAGQQMTLEQAFVTLLAPDLIAT